MMRYVFILALFALGMMMLGGQHTHDQYEVYGVATKSHDHDYDYAKCHPLYGCDWFYHDH
jgi:hypothetical protein